jgi:hypothetical protein
MAVIMPINPIKENRLGTFLINNNFLEQEPNLVMRVMGKCIIVETRTHFHSSCIEYTAYSPEFEPCENFMHPFHYNIEVKEDEEGRKLFKFIKVKDDMPIEVLKRKITF